MNAQVKPMFDLEPAQELTPQELVTSDEVLGREDAMRLTDQIRAGLSQMQDLLVVAYTRRVWVPLGYGSWNDYVAEEFQDISLKPPLESRQETMAAMRGAGMSIRAISACTKPMSTRRAGSAESVERP